MKKMDDVNLYKSDAQLAARLGINGPRYEEAGTVPNLGL